MLCVVRYGGGFIHHERLKSELFLIRNVHLPQDVDPEVKDAPAFGEAVYTYGNSFFLNTSNMAQLR